MAVRTAQYKAVWYWDDICFLTFTGPTDKSDKQARAQSVHPRSVFPRRDSVTGQTIHFLENVDQNQQKVFKQRYQRVLKQNVPNVVTLQDVKDVVTFLMVGSVPNSFLALIHSHKINKLFRALIVYFQLYLQVWDDLKYRRLAYAEQRLKHPVSVVRETLCKTNLSQLRSRIGQEYAQLVSGQGIFKRYHHMNNPLNRSYSSTDIRLYEYLVKFSSRVVWTALYRSNYKEIEVELSRLFQSRSVREESHRSVESRVTQADKNVLHGDKLAFTSHWDTITPMIADIFINDDKPQLLLNNRINSNEVTGLEALLSLPEELLSRSHLILGVLGQPRDNFEVMLHVKQGAVKNLEEQELDKAFAKFEQIEKPTVKMYQYLNDLDSTIDLNTLRGEEENTVGADIFDEIRFYFFNHLEDSKRSYSIWKKVKGH